FLAAIAWAVESSESELDFFMLAKFDVVARVLTSSLANPDGVTINPDVVSTVCKKFFKPVRVKLQSCPVSF
ncbi:hypothetical protein Tco_0870514, partial [Tanacetum coccineum]